MIKLTQLAQNIQSSELKNNERENKRIERDSLYSQNLQSYHFTISFIKEALESEKKISDQQIKRIEMIIVNQNITILTSKQNQITEKRIQI